ncbi:MAG: ethanolamine ammonia-lyase [Roseivirga sp.]|nr:ethanolamine ammonia-lyase [Roseivirga sp.]
MAKLSRKAFIKSTGLAGALMLLFQKHTLWSFGSGSKLRPLSISSITAGEDIFAYITRVNGAFDQTLYQQIIGSANPFKEGDATLGVAAESEASRINARKLLANTTIEALERNSLFTDELKKLISQSLNNQTLTGIKGWTMAELKAFILEKPEAEVKTIMPGLSSDIIACVVKLMSNYELIQVGQKVFNPLPGSKIGSKGYMSARVQPNSPTDNTDDIMMQVFCAWSYAVGDLVLGTNPVSSEPASVAAIEKTLNDILVTFGLQNTLPNCVLSHIDIQAEVERSQPGTTGIWFQSLAGTVNANETFDVTIEKMFRLVAERQGKYGLYAETGQGADFTNGHGEGFDMVVHEARKYGFLRALKQELAKDKSEEEIPWVHVNDVAGFIGPEVFKTREQLVRCCLEDTAMGKLHGLPIGLDVCSTLHMDVSLDDLDWCIEQIMPANPAYLMALPTKNDPMLSYLTTAFNNHVKIREQFGYKVNDAMWDFFKRIEVIGKDNKPTEHFGDPVWVYYQYKRAGKDNRKQADILQEGHQLIAEINKRGVPITQGHGDNIWDLPKPLETEVKRLYDDAKVSLWTEMSTAFAGTIGTRVALKTRSADRKDYVYHPESGEQLETLSRLKLDRLRTNWGLATPDVQIIISDGLNARALMDEGHLTPFLTTLKAELKSRQLAVAREQLLITNGRVRVGYQSGELLFGKAKGENTVKGIIHIIGERPGSGHHNFSAYLTAAPTKTWAAKGTVDHNISRVVSGISDTALTPALAAKQTAEIFMELFE